MKIMLWVLVLMLSTTAMAQNFMPLTEADISRLAIVFAPVTAPDRQSGSRFPATVVNSPDTLSVLTAPYAGVIDKWHVIPGERVASGAIIASVRSQPILDIQHQWLDAIGELEQAEFIKHRDEELFQQGIVSEQRAQQSRRGFQQAQIAVNSHVDKLRRGNFSDADLRKLQDYSTEPGVYSLHASADGILSHRALVVGDYVSAFNEVASLQVSDKLWLSMKIPARLATGLESGHPLTIAGSGEPLTLRQKDLVVDETTQTVELLAEFVSAVTYLPGQILSVVISPLQSGVLVPADAVIHSGNETIVFVQSGEGVQARTLRLLPAGNNYIAHAGIANGEYVVIQGAAILKGMQLGLGSTE